MGRAAERNSISNGHEMGRNMVHSGNGGPERRYTGARSHGSQKILDWEGNLLYKKSRLTSGHVEWTREELER